MSARVKITARSQKDFGFGLPEQKVTAAELRALADLLEHPEDRQRAYLQRIELTEVGKANDFPIRTVVIEIAWAEP